MFKIKGGKSLTNEELAIEIQNGKTEYLPVLWEQVERFIRKMAAQRLQALQNNPNTEESNVEFDELYDSGYFAVINAVKYFKPETGYTFLTFLSYPLKNAFNEIVGRAKIKRCDPLRTAISLETPIGEDENLTLGETLADETDIADEVINSLNTKEMHKAIDIALAKLSPLEEKAIRLEYYSGLDLKQSSEVMRISPAKVKYLRSTGMSKLRSFEVCSELLKYCPTANSKRKRCITSVPEKNTKLTNHFNDLRLRCGL